MYTVDCGKISDGTCHFYYSSCTERSHSTFFLLNSTETINPKSYSDLFSSDKTKVTMNDCKDSKENIFTNTILSSI